jgi:DNA-binding beta-propeller fold protein YncE
MAGLASLEHNRSKTMNRNISLNGGLLAAIAAMATVASAGQYETRVVFAGLDQPTGIVADNHRTLYITQLPTPGISGMNGGRNTVDMITLGKRPRITNLTTGEPEPTNLALDWKGNLYWTCKSAGVILERDRRGEVGLFLGELDQPSGIALDRWGHIYFTQIPTPALPGSMGGSNNVAVTDGAMIEILSMGEPEPSDIAADRHGNAYWTCKTAGVILKRDRHGEISLLLNDLMSPTGIALDQARGLLYFTEVPTPGVPGSQGGANRISVLNLRRMKLNTVDEGDPQPTDIAVAPNGRVFWTCTSAGVIVEARERCHEAWD